MSGGILHELAPFWVPGSRTVALLPDDEFAAGPDDLTVTMSVVDAAEPIIDTVNPTFKVKNPATYEVVVAGGLFLGSSLTNAELTFEEAGPVPSDYTVYLDSNGELQSFPQAVFCYRALSDIGYTLQSFDTEMLGPAKVRVFLIDATPGATLDVQVQVTGVSNISEVTETEVISFGSSWAGNIAGTCEQNDNQYVDSSTVWSSLSNLIVAVRSNDGPNTKIMVQALVDPVTVPSIADVLPVAEVTWSGLQVCNIRDIRPINTSLSLLDYADIAAPARVTAELAAIQLSNTLYQYWAEDFDKPRLVTTQVTDTTSGTGLAPTELTVSKLNPGLGRNDTYISRPIPVKPAAGNPEALRFIPIQPGLGFSIKARYFTAGSWTNWITSFTAPNYTINLSGAADIIKWQVVVTGPALGMYAVLLMDSDATHADFKENLGAWVDGVLI